MADDAFLDDVRTQLDQMLTVTERFASLGLEFEARGLDGDVPVPAAVFMEALARLSQLAIAIASTQAGVTKTLVAALVRSDHLRQETALDLGALQSRVDHHDRQLHTVASTLHQLTQTLLGRTTKASAASGQEQSAMPATGTTSVDEPPLS